MYTFHLLTLFPDMLQGPLNASILGRAQQRELIQFQMHDIREQTTDRHKTADDLPFGGGSGMVMKIEPVAKTIEAVRAEHAPDKIVLLSASGRPFTQELAQQWACLDSIAFVCGHYEGVDDRISHFIDDEVSIGDYVLTGGETAALVVIDAVARLQEGVLGNPDSLTDESHGNDRLLEYPHFTRPRIFRQWGVPDVLLSGNHKEIDRWRRRESLRRTLERRPDLLEKATLEEDDRLLLQEIHTERSAEEPKKT
jgi:tRNA (guanine37-N1)-methyltransferase